MNKKFTKTWYINDWEVETDEGWENIKALHKTIPYQIYILKTENCWIECANKHILFDENYNEIYCDNLKSGDYIITKYGLDKIISIEITEKYEEMYDLELYENSKRRYYVNNILSHNTELAKALATYLFDDENMLIRIDMSEYQEKHTTSKLIGAPAGYIGYEEGGQLTEQVRWKPYSVVLFDEIEKAHPDVFNTLLQVLDDGRLTDNKGRTINFKNTIIIMTSNIGSHLIYENQKQKPDKIKESILELLKKTITPEFLNRIDDISVFNILSKEEIKKIVTLQLNSLKNTLYKNNINIEFNDNVVNFLSEKGYDPMYGARPVKRAIQTYLTDELSMKIIDDTITNNDTIIIDVKKDQIIFANIVE